MGNSSSKKKATTPIPPSSSSSSAVAVKKEDNSQKFLLIHGWRTSGDILFKQTAAFRYHTEIDVVKINGPWEAKGPPDEGIAEFYPDQPYYEWWAYETNAEGSRVYEGHEKSLRKLETFLDEHGPFLGILAFSQGATMTTLLSELQETKQKKWFHCVILIGGVPPLTQYTNNTVLNIPSLHLIGTEDEHLPLCNLLVERYQPGVRRVLNYAEGHNIPSIRTNLYPEIKIWILQQRIQAKNK